MKRILSIAVVLVFTLSLFVGCGEEKKQDSTDINSQVNGEFAISTSDVVFVDANGEAVYSIVRPENAVGEITNCASYLFKQMKTKLGTAIKNISDIEDGTDAYEILVGDTNRKESASSLEYLNKKTGGRYDDYIICNVYQFRDGKCSLMTDF